jgi:diadenosine tetraphosphatase ApaH/serine/threonine PP2A family protein phosphatase
MRIGFFTDVHGNREAFDACLAHAERQRVGRHVFLGDLVGYGADPVYVVDRVAELSARGAIALVGNHDEAAINGASSGMNEYARAAIAWTHGEIDEGQRRFLAGLPYSVEEDDRLYVHSEASAPSAWLYVSSGADAERSLRATERQLTVCGHVHRPQIYHMSPNKPAVLFVPSPGSPVPLLRTRKWLAVLPAVGQPRDENPAAGYAILDTDSNELTIWRVPYDIETAVEKIHAAGLPRLLAARLFVGR